MLMLVLLFSRVAQGRGLFTDGALELLPPHLTAQFLSICELSKLFCACEIQLLVMFIDAPEGYDRFWIQHYLAVVMCRAYYRIYSPVETHAASALL